MKIEGWCGWDLGAGEEEEVAFERLRSSLRHWRWWPWLKTYRWTRCETVGRDGSSQRRPARLLRHLLTSDIETCPFSPSSDLKTRLRNSRLWHSIHLVVREEEEINHFVSGLFFSRWQSATKETSWYVRPHSESSVLGYCGEVTSSSRAGKKGHLFIRKKLILFTQLLLFRVRRMLKRSHHALGCSVVGGRKTIRTTCRRKNTYNHQFSPSPINTTLLQQPKLQLLWQFIFYLPSRFNFFL